MRRPNETLEIDRLKRRADFLHAAKGRRWHGKALSLQANARPDVDGAVSDVPRVGFTLTRKVGCAVVRNRARRRLKEAARLSGDLPLRAAHDYVVVGRIEAIRVPFDRLMSELATAVRGVHRADKDRRSTDKTPRKGPVPTP